MAPGLVPGSGTGAVGEEEPPTYRQGPRKSSDPASLGAPAKQRGDCYARNV